MKNILLIAVSLFTLNTLSAQYYRSYNEKFLFISGGPAHFFGDTGGYPNPFLKVDDLSAKNISYHLGLGFGVLFNDRIGYKVSAQYGEYLGFDGEELPRGYAFETQLLQANLEAQFVFLRGPFICDCAAFYRLYAFAGGAATYAMTERAEWVASPKNFNRFSIAVPFGIGIDIRVSQKITLGAEFRTLYFLDDMVEGLTSQTSKSNDVIESLTFTFSYTIFDRYNQVHRNWANDCFCK